MDSDENSERVELPADFVQARDKQRVSDLNEVCSMEIECSFDEVIPRDDDMDDEVVFDETRIQEVIDTVVESVTGSLSSDLVQTACDSAVNEKVIQRNLVIQKRRCEIEGLRRAITNAVNNGSCGVEKLAVIDAAINELPDPNPLKPEKPPRDPKDRRKRMRSSCFHYVVQSEVVNSLKALRNELKLSEDKLIGLGLQEVYTALESSLDKPFADTWSGVSSLILT